MVWLSEAIGCLSTLIFDRRVVGACFRVWTDLRAVKCLCPSSLQYLMACAPDDEKREDIVKRQGNGGGMMSRTPGFLGRGAGRVEQGPRWLDPYILYSSSH